MSTVTLNKLVKKYGDVQVVHGVNLQIDEGEFCVFVGPSGCGKSTLLRMIAGLESITDGVVHIGERDVTNLDAAERGIAMVFQTYALYPHMSVRDNMGFGLKMNGSPKDEIFEKVNKAADILKLGPYMDRKPKALSGGQRQRVAIGRAIVRGPDVFLFDEPLSNLDAELRLEMRVEIARLHRDLGNTMIYVTHDQVEAMTLADKIVVLRDGRIEQVGAPMDLYDNPDNKFVAGFIGSPSMNFLNAEVKGKTVSIAGLETSFPANVDLPAGSVVAGIRPEMLSVEVGSGPTKVSLNEELGGISYVHVETRSGETIVVESRERGFHMGDPATVTFNADDVLFFDAQTGERLR